MSDVRALREALRHPNIIALLRVVRAGETTQDDDAYRWLYGSTRAHPILFESYKDHPRQAFKSAWGWTSASGAYQAMCAVPGKVTTDTWGDFIKAVGPMDFSPPSQDLFAVWCIARRGALELIKEGRFNEAIQRISKEWASLPGSPYGQPTRTLAQALATYTQYGGSLAAAQAPEVKRMPIALALLQVFGPALSNLIPQIGKFLGNPDVVSRNLDAAQAIVDTVVQTSKSPDLASAIEAMKADPSLAKEVAQAVVSHPDVLGLVEVGGGIAAARDAGIKSQGDKPFWFNPVFVVTLLLLPLVYYIIASVLIGGVDLPEDAPWWALLFFKLFGTSFTPEVRAGTVGTVLGTVLGGIVGIWFGTSYGSMKKDDTINTQANK